MDNNNINQNLIPNILSSNNPLKLEFNKIPKVSNFFRGEIVNTNKQPKKLSYDIKEIYLTSRIKENEFEPKLILKNFPPAFQFKNSHNSNDSKTTNHTKYSSNEPKNNYKLNYSNETSLDDVKEINNEIETYKQKKKIEEDKKINNFFIEEEINVQRQLQTKKNFKNNNDIHPLKIISKNVDNHNIIFIDNNSDRNNNNFYIKTDSSEYEGLRPANNMIDLEYNSKKINKKINMKNSTFNRSSGDNFKNLGQNLKQNTFNSKNKNNFINNEILNSSDIYNKNYRKTSDSDIYPTKLNYNYDEKNTIKKNEHSGSYMNIINCQNILKDEFYSPNKTKVKIEYNTNNNFLNGRNTMKENDQMRLSAKPLLKPIIPYRKNSQDNDNNSKIKLSKFIADNIKNINILKNQKVSVINENILNEIDLDKANKKNVNSININEGITFTYMNGFKYYFNLKNANIYFLKEVQYHFAKGIPTSINIWNKYFNNNKNYLNIISRKLNTPENHYTYILEYPKGGESLNNIVNSIGLNEQRTIYLIISEVYNNILKIKKEENKVIQDFNNIPFCLCNLFLTINEELKIMPPVIRKIPINSSKSFNQNFNNINNKNNLNKKDSQYNICECKKNYDLLKKQFDIHKNNISYFCLGLSILQLITQNFLFQLKSYNILINNHQNINNNNIKCCLLHSIINIEEKKCNKNNDLLLLNFLYQYDDKLIDFIHQCTKFDEIKNYPNSVFLENYYMIEKRVNISMKELFKLINLTDNDYISLDNFLKNFKLLFNDMKINKEDFKLLLDENEVIEVISRNFNIDKKELKNKIYKIIDNDENYNDNDIDNDEINQIYANSGNCFFNVSSLKKLENNISHKVMTINNDENYENKNNLDEYKKNLVIFKNYKYSEINNKKKENI